MKKNISNILNFRIGLIVICANILIGVSFYAFLINITESNFQQDIHLQSKNIADSITQQLWILDFDTVEQLTTLTVDTPNIDGLRLQDHNHKLLAEKGSFGTITSRNIQKNLYYTDGTLLGYLDLYFVNSAWEAQRKRTLFSTLMMVGITILITFIVISYVIKRNLVDPLYNLQQGMKEAGKGKFKLSDLNVESFEIQTIIDVFNKMVTSLAHREEEQVQAEAINKDLEKELRQKHKMEAVGYMAGGMAHNFNNDLSIILGNVELSQMKQAPNSEAIPLLENAKIAVRHSRDLVKKIITYSRRGTQVKVPIQLSSIIDETLSLIRSTLPSSVNLQQIISPESSSVVIDADATQIQEVLVNLCNNAVHAMDEKGVLKISLEPVELTQKDIPAQYEQTPGRYAKLSVQDTGAGMPSEMLDKIFDPFFTTKEDYEGAGMGLATVQGVVVQHGGLIKVNSVPDQGTVFDLYFPIVDVEITEPVPTNPELPRGTELILLVDDDEMLASLGEKLLTQMGYQVSVMTDSTEALKLFTANADHIDLVITDQTMPDLTGKDLIQEIKKIRPDIPTILCTGFSTKIDDVQAAELGINAFLMKPLDLPELSQTVRRVLDEKEK